METNQQDKLGWRPLKFSTPEELEAMVDKYFKDWHRKKEVITTLGIKVKVPAITMSDLALYLWFDSRQSLYDYEKKQEFSYTIKRARLFIEREYEERLSGQSPTGAIFALKNMGWKDKSEVDNNIKGELKVNNTKDMTDEELIALQGIV